ncbi:hypothetical protein P692DRAFT_20228326 [Suillus brevipes Sb2]|nr:hypothetical protein P692DRAFT_20228326 [Suillus brevipes Sb2]
MGVHRARKLVVMLETTYSERPLLPTLCSAATLSHTACTCILSVFNPPFPSSPWGPIRLGATMLSACEVISEISVKNCLQCCPSHLSFASTEHSPFPIASTQGASDR